MRVITYGTCDLFHEGHVRLLRRAKALGDHLTVGVTTENYDDARGKLNVQQNVMERINNVQDSGLADEVIIEEYEGQKVNDLQKHSIDVFAIGSDWAGKFDYLKDYCQVVYLERTEGISSTSLCAANHGILKLGVVGTGRIAHRFLAESHFAIAGTQECIDVPAPLEDRVLRDSIRGPADEQEVHYEFDGDGLRYDLAECASMVKDSERRTFELTPEELTAISGITEEAKTNKMEIR